MSLTSLNVVLGAIYSWYNKYVHIETISLAAEIFTRVLPSTEEVLSLQPMIPPKTFWHSSP